MRGSRLVIITLLLFPLVLAAPVPAFPATTHTLFPIGGGYSDVSLQAFAQAVIRQAAPPAVKILVVPSAYGGNNPETGDNEKLAGQRTQEIQDACNAVVNNRSFPGGCQATLLPLFSRDDALNPANSAAFNDPETAGGFFLGGDQDVAMEVLAGTPAETAMAHAFNRGVVFGGTSAGAAMQSHTMTDGFTGGYGPRTELQQGSVDMWWSTNSLQRGLSFGSNNMIFDEHFYQRGRVGRLLTEVALSADQFGGGGLLGVGSDYETGAVTSNDSLISSIFGASSVMLADFKSAGGSYRWAGTPATLSARNVLTDLMAPGDGFSYDVVHRVPLQHNQPLPFHAPASGWQLQQPGPGTLILGGDVSTDWTGPSLAAFVSRAQATGSNRIVVVTAGYGSPSSAQSAANAYASGLSQAGWTGKVDTVAYGTPSWSGDTHQLDGAAGVLFAGGDQSAMAGPLADSAFAGYVRYAVAHAPVVMTDRAMTAVMGAWYVTNPDPTSKTLETQAVSDFLQSGSQIAPGLGIVGNFSLEPRLTADYRWGRLYSLAQAHPGQIVLGISDATAIVLDESGSHVAGDLSVISLDGRAATFGTGSNGAISAYNVVLDAFAPGDSVTG